MSGAGLGVGQPGGALGGGGHDDREDPPDQVRAAGRGVVVGRVEQRLDGEPDRLVAADRPGRYRFFSARLGEQRARADAVVVGLLVEAAGDVEAEDPAGLGRVGGVQVVPGEERDDGEALHRGAEVVADHRGEPVRLAVEREHRALDLLVVLQLDLEQPDQLDADAGRAGDADQRVRVGGVDLLDVAAGDQVAHGGPAVAGHDHAVGVGQRDDRGGVRSGRHRAVGRQRPPAGQQLGRVAGEVLGEGRRAGAVEKAGRRLDRIQTRRHCVLLEVGCRNSR